MQNDGVQEAVGTAMPGTIPGPGMMGVPGMGPAPTMQASGMLGAPEGAQQFCLRWNSYPATVATQLATLRAGEDFVDVTLACDGRQLRAHKLVLAACSPYFMQLFKSTPCQHPVIFLKDVGFRQLQALLEFMYAGEVNVSQVELPALLRTAEALQVRGLADTTANNNNNSTQCNAPPKPSFSPPYGQPVNTPVMSNVSSVPIVNEEPMCPEVNAQTSEPANAPKPARREERSNSDTKREVVEDEENSNDSIESMDDFDGGDHGFNGDGNIAEQADNSNNAFGGEQDGSEPGRIDVHNASAAGSQSEGESSEDDDDDDGECKDLPYSSDASYGQDTLPEGSANGEIAGPSGSGSRDGEDANCKPDGPASAGSGSSSGSRNRLSRQLWPPGIPYHGPQQCPYCPRTLSNVGNWRKHVLTMHFAREKVYKCRHCASSFRTAEYLQKHYVRVHNYPQKMTRRKDSKVL